MNIVEFFLRVLDNVIWIVGTDNPGDIFTAIVNIFSLIFSLIG